MSVFGVIDPPECDERGVPLDWERCRACSGTGSARDQRTMDFCRRPCSACDGHGSLKAAALAGLISRRQMANAMAASMGSDDVRDPHRCEDCGHPMSGGTWETTTTPIHKPLGGNEHALWSLAGEPTAAHPNGIRWVVYRVHYSPCDEGCRHGGPGHFDGDPEGQPIMVEADDLRGVGPAQWPEASWRPVDVRTLGWPHDLRPEKLAVLCLRCYAARASGDGLVPNVPVPATCENPRRPRS